MTYFVANAQNSGVEEHETVDGAMASVEELINDGLTGEHITVIKGSKMSLAINSVVLKEVRAPKNTVVPNTKKGEKENAKTKD